MFEDVEPIVGDAGAGEGSGSAAVADEPIVGDLGGGADESSDLDLGEPKGDEVTPGEGEGKHEDKQTDKEEPELSDFRGQVSGRIRAFIKEAPELGQIFKKYPKIQSQVESTFRREAAMREIFPTVAEARTMREHFPNGVQDVQALLAEQQESEAVDSAFYTPGPKGDYPSHDKLLRDMWADDSKATLNLLKQAPRVWAQLDRASYNQVMSEIVGATFTAKNIPNVLAQLVNDAKDKPELQADLKALQNWVAGYTSKPEPTAQDRELDERRANLDKEEADRRDAAGKEFHARFISDAKKLQMDTIGQHRIMKKLAEVKSITPEKKTEIAEKVRKGVEQLLTKSPAFMKKLRAAYNSRNTEELAKLQKAAWSQPWLLNRMIRTVLKQEVPQLVQGNREVVGRRTGTPAAGTPANTGGRQTQRTPTGPFKGPDGRWYKKTGEPFTTVEILKGAHLQP